jgi:hypothetical protein
MVRFGSNLNISPGSPNVYFCVIFHNDYLKLGNGSDRALSLSCSNTFITQPDNITQNFIGMFA